MKHLSVEKNQDLISGEQRKKVTSRRVAVDILVIHTHTSSFAFTTTSINFCGIDDDKQPREDPVQCRLSPSLCMYSGRDGLTKRDEIGRHTGTRIRGSGFLGSISVLATSPRRHELLLLMNDERLLVLLLRFSSLLYRVR